MPSNHHNESLEKEIKKYASDYITRESSRVSLITITRADFSFDNKHVVLHVSVLPERAEPIAMNFLKRHQDEIRQYVIKHVKGGMMPWFRFTLDAGEKNRQRVEELLREDAE
jgi:ribosome-binding factor A